MLDRNINIDSVNDGCYNSIGHTEPSSFEISCLIMFAITVSFIVGFIMGVSF